MTLDDRPVYELLKLVVDLAVATFAVVVLAPLLLLIALLVKLDSPGPVLFVHERVGRGGRRFKIYKFRTMRSEASLYARTPRDDHDDRLTRFGRFLRNHGLDELPQLLNVIKGDMSLVGPRPEMPFIVDTYTEHERERLWATPGITGLWQVDAPHDAPIHEHIEYDLDYLKRRSLMLDLWIMLRTVPILFGKRRRRRGHHPAADDRGGNASSGNA